MNYLVQLHSKNIGTEINSVNARELHNYLGAKKVFANWIKDRIAKYDFKENQDYIIIETKKAGNNATLKEYYITLDMAKELSMVENNEKGREARRWFIEIAKQHLATATPTQLDFITPYEVRRDLTTARRLLTIEKKKHRETAKALEAKIAEVNKSTLTQENFKNILNDLNKTELRAFNLQRENAQLKHTLIFLHNRLHEIMSTCSVKDLQKTLTQLTNHFQTLPNITCNGKNLNTDTIAGHSHWS